MSKKDPEDLPPPTDVEDEDIDTSYADADEPLDTDDQHVDDRIDVDKVDTDVDTSINPDNIDRAEEDDVDIDNVDDTDNNSIDVDNADDKSIDVDETDDNSIDVDEVDDEAIDVDGVTDEEAHLQAVSWYQNRWRDIQIDFVDTPRDAVANADRLVADVIEQLTTALAEERNKLAAQWSQDDVSTENLRVAFQSYRSFFERLVAT